MRVRRTADSPAGSRSSFDLLLAADCPRCRAAIAIEEGASAVACPICHDPFLVAPRTHPLEVVVAPAVATEAARLEARTYLRAGNHRATWIGHGGWRLLPYWRYRSKAFQWIAGLRQRPPGAASRYHDLEVRTFDLLLPAAADAPFDLPPRPGVYPARPLTAQVVGGASTSAVDLSFEAAQTRAQSEVEIRTDPGSSRAVKRRLVLVGEEMLVVHLPFFSLEYRFHDEQAEVLVDGLLGGVIAHRKLEEPRGAPAGGRAGTAPSPAAGRSLLLPIACPSCTSPFPLGDDDLVHSCPSCGRGWEMALDALVEVRQRLAVTPAASARGARYLPFWVVVARFSGFSPIPADDPEGRDHGELPVYVPAFESWQIEKLVHLGVRLTRARLRYPAVEPVGKERREARAPARLEGATLRRREAERLAWVILGSLATADLGAFSAFMEEGKVDVRDAELHWLPFRPSGFYWHEPLSGALVRGWPAPGEKVEMQGSGSPLPARHLARRQG